ncbi:MAG TPA: glycosyltransferase family 4 protein [Candidatus Acidoferrum sp.]|nr:glycosyltransferase family 4 protein [Candidatus Acidoferrum sp.]
MRIAVLSPFVDRRYGTERSLAEIVERLARHHGHEIHLYSQWVDDLQVTPYETREHDSSQGIVWHRVPRLPAPHLFAFLFWIFANRFCRLFDRWFRHLRFDAVFSPGINATNADLILVHVVFHRLRELQLERSSEGLRGLHRALYYRLLCFLENRVYGSKALRLAAVSRHTARQLTQYFGRRDAVVAPNGVDLSLFSPASRLALRDTALRRLGYFPDDIVLLLIGNDWRNKGLPTLLEAMSRLNHPTLRLSVVGSDTPAGFLHQVQSLQLSNRVKFFPETSEILAFYAAADIYAAPSLEDSFNLPVLEAMACGLPVLVSRLAGISDYIADGVDGILLQDPGDPSALAGSLSLLLQQPELRRSLGENAARKAQHFSWDRQADAIHRLLSGSEPEP